MKYVRTNNGLEKMTEAQYEAYEESIKPEKTNIEKRVEAYGSWQEQMEIISEQGVEALQERNKLIKEKYPKE